jgi:hypothetical protein
VRWNREAVDVSCAPEGELAGLGLWLWLADGIIAPAASSTGLRRHPLHLDLECQIYLHASCFMDIVVVADRTTHSNQTL